MAVSGASPARVSHFALDLSSAASAEEERNEMSEMKAFKSFSKAGVQKRKGREGTLRESVEAKQNIRLRNPAAVRIDLQC